MTSRKKMYPYGHIRRKGLWDHVENLAVYDHDAPWRSHCGHPQSGDVTVPNTQPGGWTLNPHHQPWASTVSKNSHG